MMGRLYSLQVGMPRTYGVPDAADPMDREWITGIFKDPVAGPVRLTHHGLEGDGQADLRFHGGADKALNAYARAHYPGWQAEWDRAELSPGAFGENLTLEGLDEETVSIGDVFRMGDAVLQVSQPRYPCWKLERKWRRPGLAARVVETGRTGWYFRVLTEGMLEAGQAAELLDRPCPDWTVLRTHDALFRQKDPALAAELARLAPLAGVVREWAGTKSQKR
jgi:MOSC domain-containing protein YiiM